MKRVSIFLIFIFSTLTGCLEAPVTASFTPDELVLGSWKVTKAVVGGVEYPVYNPGLGQIEVEFAPTEYTFVYPLINEAGQLSGETDTVSGRWEFANDFTIMNLYDSIVQDSITMNMEIKELKPGIFKTLYYGQSVVDPTQLTTYEIDYALFNE